MTDNLACPYCKNEITGHELFCAHCGWFLSQPIPKEDPNQQNKEIEEARIFLAMSSHEKFKIEKANTTLGREMGDIVIRDDLELSRLHCEFIYKNHKLHVKDLNSHNGVFLGDRKLPPDEEIPLQPDDKLKIGSNVFTVEFKSDLGVGEETGPVYYLKSSETKKEYQLRLGENLVGRGEFCHIRIDDAPFVAHEHAIVELKEESRELGKISVRVQDKGSKNQTTLNGVALAPFKWKDISEGDQVSFADKSFQLLSKPREK